METMEISDASDNESGSLTDLFGKKDLDLRTMPPSAPALNNLQAVRAKLAEVSKKKDKLGRPLLYNQLPSDPVERKRKISLQSSAGDIDLRQTLHVQNEDNLKQNMNRIVAQAQDEFKNKKITQDQYQLLLQQVIEAAKLAAEQRQFPTVPGPPMPPAIVGTSPWSQPPPAIQPATVVLQPVQPVAENTVRTIQIDNVPRAIRFYGETAVIFMSDEDPRKIGFEHGQRPLRIDNADPVVLRFNDDYVPLVINGTVHQIRFGMYAFVFFVYTTTFHVIIYLLIFCAAASFVTRRGESYSNLLTL